MNSALSSEDHSAPAIEKVVTAASRRRFLWRLMAVLAGGMFLDGYILGIIGPVTGTISGALGLSSLGQGVIAAAALAGVLIGAPIGGWAADKFGRKPLFIADMAIFFGASAVQFFVDEAWQLFVVRLLMGVAIGMEYSVGWPLLSEFAPARLRGRLMFFTLIAWYSGFMTAFAIGYMLNERNVSWQIILGTSTILAGALFLGRIGLPESPRWLWSQGRKDEALSIASRCMESFDDMVDVEHEDVRKGTFGLLFSQRYRKTTLFTSVFWFCAVTPYFAIATFAESVLHDYGLGGGLAGGIGLSGIAVVAVAIGVLFIDRVGRRALTIPPATICAVALAIIGLWVGAPPLVVLSLFFVFSFFTAICGTMASLYPSEMFSTEVRGIGTGFAAAISRIGAALGTFLLPWSMTNLGSQISMLIAAAIAAVGAVLAQLLAPETKGKSLTETAAGFTH